MKLVIFLVLTAITGIITWYRKSRGLDAGDKGTIDEDGDLVKDLRQHMADDEPWRDPDLSILHLAGAVGVGRGRLSRALNRTAERNFHQFVNDYRIEAAKALLLDLNNPDDNVDEIAGQVGFHSRSAFYEAFEARVQMTPGDWRLQRQGDLPGFDES